MNRLYTLLRLQLLGVATALSATACAPSGGYKITPIPADQTLNEQVVYRESKWTSNRIALIDVDGILMNAQQSNFFGEGEHPVALIVEKLAAAAADDDVKAIVLRVNSPGGTVTASDILYREILAFKRKTGKPVVANFQDLAASGGYYLSCAADRITAQPTTITGSIGVIMQMFDLSSTLDKIGVKTKAIKSGPLKDVGSPFRELKPEEERFFQKLVDDFYARFVDVVAEGRPKLTRDEVVKLADGRVYNADQALEVGLIDRICTLQEAVDEAKDLAGVKSANTVIYHRPMGWKANMYAESPHPEPRSVNLFNFVLPSVWTKPPQFMYIWDPSL